MLSRDDQRCVGMEIVPLKPLFHKGFKHSSPATTYPPASRYTPHWSAYPPACTPGSRTPYSRSPPCLGSTPPQWRAGSRVPPCWRSRRRFAPPWGGVYCISTLVFVGLFPLNSIACVYRGFGLQNAFPTNIIQSNHEKTPYF